MFTKATADDRRILAGVGLDRLERENRLCDLRELLPCRSGEERCDMCDAARHASCIRKLDGFCLELMYCLMERFAHESRLMRQSRKDVPCMVDTFEAHCEDHAEMMGQLAQIIDAPAIGTKRSELRRLIDVQLAEHDRAHDSLLRDILARAGGSGTVNS